MLLWLGRSGLFRDPGTLWHIVVGQRIWASGQLIQTDPFSFTCLGQHWLAQEWLGECALALLHWWSGLDGVLLATATVVAVLYTWVAGRLLRAGLHPLLTLLVVALALAATAPCLHPRPNLATVVFLGITFAALVAFEAGRCSLRRLFWLVPVYVLWTNIHGGMLGGLGTIGFMMGGWLLVRAWPRQTGRLRLDQAMRLGLLLLACTLTILVNPYGLALPRTWLALLRSPVLSQLIQEHLPLYRVKSAGVVLLFGAFYLLSLLTTRPRQMRVSWFLPLVWLYLTWTRHRHSPLFAITAALALADMLPQAGWVGWLAKRGSEVFRVRAREEAGRSSGRAWVGLACALFVAAAGLQAAGVRWPFLGRGWARLAPDDWPVETLPALRTYTGTHPSGTAIFNDMTFGGFLMYETPGLRVFVDDRCELYGDERLLEYASAFWHDGSRIEGWRKRYGFEMALVERRSAFEAYLRGAGAWELVCRGKVGSLYRWVGDGRPALKSGPRPLRGQAP